MNLDLTQVIWHLLFKLRLEQTRLISSPRRLDEFPGELWQQQLSTRQTLQSPIILSICVFWLHVSFVLTTANFHTTRPVIILLSWRETFWFDKHTLCTDVAEFNWSSSTKDKFISNKKNPLRGLHINWHSGFCDHTEGITAVSPYDSRLVDPADKDPGHHFVSACCH